MRKLLTGWMMFFHLTVLLAQPDSHLVKGKVTDKNGSPVAFGYVRIPVLSLAVMTDASGNYEIKNVPAGTHIVEAESFGFITQTKSITCNNHQTILHFSLQEDVKLLEEVMISAPTAKEELQNSAKAVDVVETKEVKLQTSDLGEVMARTQGVGVRRSGGLGSGSDFSLNGFSGDKIRFFLDGVPLEYTGHMFGISNIPLTLVERIEIYKGVVPIQLGADALGGAVNLISPPLKHGLNGLISYQTGSFGTHRTTLDIKYLDDSTGLFIGGGGFYDNARNNYKVHIDIPNEKGKLTEKEITRFHDTYKAGGANLTIGVKNKSWADELSIKGFYTAFTKDIQHNSFMTGIPYGKVVSYRNSTGFNLTYHKKIGEKIAVGLYSGYAANEREFVDTSYNVYDWYGNVVLIKRLRGEVPNEPPSHQFTWDKNMYARIHAAWKISDHHTLRLSLAPTYNNRRGDEKLSESYDPYAAKGRLTTWINGLEHELDMFSNKLENILFVKEYLQKISFEEAVPQGLSVITEKITHYFGGGNALRYKITPRLNVKASYEYATRFPRTDEYFGDGFLSVSNIDLKPERSHNANVALNWKNSADRKSVWEIGINTFLRKVNNLIILMQVGDAETMFKNVLGATSSGFELSGNWISQDGKINIGANTTYQHFYNSSQGGEFGTFYGDRIPNTPYFFANGSASYTLKNAFNTKDNLIFFGAMRYSHGFYVGWESAGTNKQEIPNQQLYSGGITYKFLPERSLWALTGEVQNILNGRIYDFYGVQKPGRAFYLKLTMQF